MSAARQPSPRRRRGLQAPVDELRVDDHDVATFRSQQRVRLFHVELDERTVGWVQGDRRGYWRGYVTAAGEQLTTAYPSRCRAVRAVVKRALAR